VFGTSYIEIDRKAYAANLSFIRGLIDEKVRLCAVVKGNAYGHGIEALVPIAEHCGVDYFGVFSADEALRVRNIADASTDVMIMGMVEGDQIHWAIAEGVEFFVFDFERLEMTVSFAQKLNKPAKVHIEVESGMNRTGFADTQQDQLMKYLQENGQWLHLRGLCTHFAGAENLSNKPRILAQLAAFHRWKELFEQEDLKVDLVHAACSAATLRYPETHFDLVRVGILQYGLWPNVESEVWYRSKNESVKVLPKRLISWKSSIMHIKEVPAGEYIGYSTSYYTVKDTRIGVVPVGYSHGFSRGLSNLGRVLVNGQRVSVIGLVNMNALMINLNDVPETKKGDEVVIIGKQGDFELSIGSFSDLSHQLNYESVTRLDPAIPRIIKN
jgi:alanine racemase